MPFRNRIRLPFKITKPQFPEEREVFRKANGVTETISSIIRKTYLGETDIWPEKWHERFTTALSHDKVVIEGEKYFGDVAKDGDYTIEWPDFLDYPAGKAAFSVEVTPFNASNQNCQSCDEVTQADLADDKFPDAIVESTEYELNVADNDNICCFPAMFNIVSYNSDILDSAVIDNEGNITINTKSGIFSATDALLLTYRVTCPNGNYDQANVYADIDGEEACVAPANVRVVSTDTGIATLEWDAVVGAVDYSWQLWSSDEPGDPVQTGSTSDTSIDLTGLTEDHPVTYTLYVLTNCAEGSSDYALPLVFNNAYVSASCGYYKFTFTGSPSQIFTPKALSYTGCTTTDPDGGTTNVNTIMYQNAYGCLLETEPGVPVYWSGVNGVIIEYLGLCGAGITAPFTINNSKPNLVLTQVIYDGVNLLATPLNDGESFSGVLATGANRTIVLQFNKSTLPTAYADLITSTNNLIHINITSAPFGPQTYTFNNITVDSSGLIITIRG